MSNTALTARPSSALYRREHAKAQELLADGAEAYEWGYTAANLDIAAGLTEMTDDDHDNLWLSASSYAEGYRDSWEDHRRFG